MKNSKDSSSGALGMFCTLAVFGASFILAFAAAAAREEKKATAPAKKPHTFQYTDEKSFRKLPNLFPN